MPEIARADAMIVCVLKQPSRVMSIPERMNDDDLQSANLEAGELSEGLAVAAERVAESISQLDGGGKPSNEIWGPELTVESSAEVGPRKAAQQR